MKGVCCVLLVGLCLFVVSPDVWAEPSPDAKYPGYSDEELQEVLKSRDPVVQGEKATIRSELQRREKIRQENSPGGSSHDPYPTSKVESTPDYQLKKDRDRIDRDGFDSVMKYDDPSSGADDVMGVGPLDDIIRVHVPANERDPKTKAVLSGGGDFMQDKKSEMDDELRKREERRQQQNLPPTAANNKNDGGASGGGGLWDLVKDPAKDAYGTTTDAIKVLVDYGKDEIDKMITGEGLKQGDDVFDAVSKADKNSKLDQEKAVLEGILSDPSSSPSEKAAAEALLIMNKQGLTIDEVTEGADNTPSDPPPAKTPPPQEPPPPQDDEVTPPPVEDDETEYVDDDETEYVDDTGGDDPPPSSGQTKQDLQDQLDYLNNHLKNLDPNNPDDAWAIRLDNERRQELLDRLQRGDYAPDPSEGDEPPLSGDVPESVGGIVTFVDDWENDQSDQSDQDRDLNDANDDLDDATTTGDDERGQARNLRDKGGEDARSIGDKSAHTTATEDQKNSWGNTIADGLTDGFTQGGKEFGKSFGKGAADKVLRELEGDDEDKKPEPGGTVPPPAKKPPPPGKSSGGGHGGKGDNKDKPHDDPKDDDHKPPSSSGGGGSKWYDYRVTCGNCGNSWIESCLDCANDSPGSCEHCPTSTVTWEVESGPCGPGVEYYQCDEETGQPRW